MTLRTTEAGLALIRQYEGLRLTAYRCPAGVLTIGYGHTSAAGEPKVTSGMRLKDKAEAEEIFERDVDSFENQVEQLVGNAKLSPHQFDALVSLSFNIGIGAFGRSTVLKRVKAGMLDRVPEAIMWFNRVKGAENDGLTKRRRSECALFRDDPHQARKTAPQTNPKAAMPQRVDEPKAPKSVIKSSEAQAGTAGGLLGTVAAGKAAMDVATDAGGSAKGFADMAMSVGPWVLLAVAIAALAAYVVWRRHQRLQIDRV